MIMLIKSVRETLLQIRSRATHLGLDTSPNIAAVWELPTPPAVCHVMVYSINFRSNWKQLGFSVGFIKLQYPTKINTKAIASTNRFMTALMLIQEAETQEGEGDSILCDDRSLAEALLNPSVSPWKVRLKQGQLRPLSQGITLQFLSLLIVRQNYSSSTLIFTITTAQR